MNLIELDAETFNKELSDGNNTILIDVRTDMEFQSGHIKNAVLMDCSSPDFSEKIEGLDKSKKYLIYCHSGGRSFQVGQYMISKGIKNVAHLEAGIISWQYELI